MLRARSLVLLCVATVSCGWIPQAFQEPSACTSRGSPRGAIFYFLYLSLLPAFPPFTISTDTECLPSKWCCSFRSCRCRLMAYLDIDLEISLICINISLHFPVYILCADAIQTPPPSASLERDISCRLFLGVFICNTMSISCE